MPSIGKGTKQKFPVDLAQSPDELNPVEKAAAELGQQLETIKTERKQERYFWIFCVVALLNVIVISFAPVLASGTFLIFSLIALIGLASWLEVPWIVRHLERWLDRTHNAKPGETE